MENSETIKVYFAKLNAKAIIPNKRKEDAGYDFFACCKEKFIQINPFETSLIPTGISWACSQDFYMQMQERSSTGSKGMKVSAGIIDSGYHGEIKIAIYNANTYPIFISNLSETELKERIDLPSKYIFHSTDKAIAQGIIHRVENTQIYEITPETLLAIPSERKDQGFGSTDK